MASLLTKAIKKAVAKGFHNQLLKGTIRRATNPALDSFGDVQTTHGHVDYPFEGIRENFDVKYRAQALIPETDVKILVILGSIKPTSVNLIPRQSDQVNINGAWHQIREILTIDPAGASASLQCYQIPLSDVIA